MRTVVSTIRTDKLRKVYGGRQVVSDVSISVSQGEVVGLLGPNGAGKTTSFYMIVGMVRPDSGHIFLDDIEMTDKPMYKRARLGVGYLPQEASIFRKLSVEERIGIILLDFHRPIRVFPVGLQGRPRDGKLHLVLLPRRRGEGAQLLLILPPAIQLHAVIMHALKKLPGFLSDTGPGFHEQLRRLLRPGAHRRLKAQHACCHRRKQLPVTSLWPVLFYFLHTR